MKYDVVYLWQQERHHGGQHPTLKAARDERDAFIRDGWRAWVEDTNGRLY